VAAHRRVPAVCPFLEAEPLDLRRPFLDAAENLSVERWWDADHGVPHPAWHKVAAIPERQDLLDEAVGKSAGLGPRLGDEHLPFADALHHAFALPKARVDAVAPARCKPDEAQSAE
jgi:hypothetical protein